MAPSGRSRMAPQRSRHPWRPTTPEPESRREAGTDEGRFPAIQRRSRGMSDVFGDVQFSGEDMTWPVLKYDRLAVGSRGELLLISVVAPTQIVKGIRGWLHTSKRGMATATGGKVKKSHEDDSQLRDPGNLAKLDCGYATEVHRL